MLDLRALQVGISGLSLLGSGEGSSRESEDSERLELHLDCGYCLMEDGSLCCRKDVQVAGWNEGDRTRCTRT